MERAAGRVLAGLAGAYLLLFVVVALLRLDYPFELEFLEGTSVTIVSRLARGEKFYVPPSLEFIPSNYTPLYYYVSALLARGAGIGFLPLRLVSLAASVASLTLIHLQVRRETGSLIQGLLSAGFFAACYGLVGAWYDLGRNDSLFLALLLGGVYLVRFRPETGWTIGASALVALSFFTKQTAALIAPALVGYTLLTNRRQCVVLTGTLIALAGGGILLLEAVSDGWFRYYVFRIAGLHPFTWDGFHRFWKGEMLPFFGPALVLTGWLFVHDFRACRTSRLLFYLLLTSSAVGSSWMIRSHEGAYVNVLMPACAALAMTFGVALQAATEQARERRLQGALQLWPQSLALGQFLLLVYSPFPLLPDAADRQAGLRVVEQLAAIPGEIWMPQHGYLAERAGKRPHANGITIWDVTADRAADSPGQKLQQEILSSLAARRFTAIIFGALPDGRAEGKPGFIDRFYRFDGRLYLSESAAAFRPRTGSLSRPELVFLPASN